MAFGGFAQTAAYPLPQLGQFDGQGSELAQEIIGGGHDSQAASQIPAGGSPITGCLCLRCNRESSCRYGLSNNEVRYEPSTTTPHGLVLTPFKVKSGKSGARSAGFFSF